MIRMIAGSEYAPVGMTWAHPFRRDRMAGLAGFGLAAGESSAVSEGIEQLRPVFEQMDHLEVMINGLADQALVAPEDVHAYHDGLTAFRQQAVDLQTQLDSTGATEAWHASVRMLSNDVSAFQARVTSAIWAAPARWALRVGAWVGVVVAGAIGVGFLIRHYGKMGKRGGRG
jgi:hypothetical protein